MEKTSTLSNASLVHTLTLVPTIDKAKQSVLRVELTQSRTVTSAPNISSVLRELEIHLTTHAPLGVSAHWAHLLP